MVTQVVGSIIFTIGYYIPLKQIMGAAQRLSSYAQYLTPLIVLQAIWFAAVSAAFRSATDSVQGINRRFRAMPIASLTPLASRMTASMYRCAIALAVSVSRAATSSVSGSTAAWGTPLGFCLLVLLIGAALAFIGDLIGIATQNPEATAPLMLVPQLTLGSGFGRPATGRTVPGLDPRLRSESTAVPIGLRTAGIGRRQHRRGPRGDLVGLGPGTCVGRGHVVVVISLHARVSKRRP